MKRSPIKRRPRKKQPEDDPKYLEFIRHEFCIVGMEHGSEGCSRVTEAHHAGDHGYAQRAPDRTALPLCISHHRTGKYAVHVLGKRFWTHHGLDRDRLIQLYNALYDGTAVPIYE